ncbi:MAG TPA: PP2C family protein-serine/threonine phosphatase [Candidatus Polarisedimenticolaceae bacterium]|nr:PP2C family protein-serine/threonine phosphatase [Candidatus Polarisedimenticolaceae bacterium]
MNYRQLFGKLEQTLARIERTDDSVTLTSAILERVVEDFRDDLGLTDGRFYVRRGDRLVLESEFPPSADHLGYEIPVSYPPVAELFERGFVLHEPDDPGVDSQIEDPLGVRTFAAIQVGPVRQQVLAFGLRDRSDREHVIYMLNTIRHAVNLKLRQQHLEDRVAEAREIQLSLLPSAAPRFHDYDVHGATRTAEEVGGDLYDFLPVSSRSLGIAIADSAGHGLPAALQARDAIIGLRMGVEERLRLTATIEKLNRVVSQSALITRFITLFYGEVEPNGNLVYCNAGHPPPLLLRDGRISELREGGLLLGPNPDARYERGYTMMAPGSVLLLYTDGISEATGRDGTMFGTKRLRALLRSRDWGSARELVEAAFAEVRAFSAVDPPADDQTVVAVVRRPQPSPSSSGANDSSR